MPKRAQTTRPRLSVCMIVRDEAAVLARCLDSLQGIHDELCIVDTGSRDDTVAIARAHGAQVLSYTACNGPDGRIADFAAARNAALAMAGGNWVLQIDADEILATGHTRLRRHLSRADCDIVTITMVSNGARWRSGRLFRRTDGIRYRSRIHEHLEHAGPSAADARIVIENRQNKTGKESSSDRNIRLLLLATRDEPEEARNFHYLGNEFRELQRFAEAIACYRRALELDNYRVGRFHTCYYLAVCHLLQADWPQALDMAFAAVRIDPRYAEGHCLLGDIYCSMSQPGHAQQWYRSALSVKRPPADAVMAVQVWAYDSHPRAQLAKLAAAGP